MDGFVLVVVGCGVAIVAVLFAVGRWYPGSGAEVLDWEPTRSLETELELELEDIDQMIEAQNARRRRTGRPEISEDSIRAEVDAERREIEARRDAYRERGE